MPLLFNNIPVLLRPDISPLSPPKILGICQEELDRMFTDRSQQMVLKEQMKRRVEYFQTQRGHFVKKPLFEQYGSFSFEGKSIPAYVMRFNHVSGLANLRIFFILYEGEMVLLHAFQETNSGSYDNASKVAKGRLSAHS